jgi:hypothetical protein
VVNVLAVTLSDFTFTGQLPADLVSMGSVFLVLGGTVVLSIFFFVVTV